MTPDPNPAASFETAGVTVTPLSVHIGAEIGGVDLRADLSSETVAAIRAALLRWKVVFFRDQNLDHEAHIRFARRFGEPTPGHVVFGGDAVYPEIYSVAKHRLANVGRPTVRHAWSGWHADVTPAVNPPFASILRGVVVPPYGGDTQWTNLAVAYQALSPALRGFLTTLRALHVYGNAAASEAQSTDSKSAYFEKVNASALSAEHPLVTVHPETGEEVLYVSPSFVRSIVDLTPTESRSLLEMLWEHAVRPEYTVRFKWDEGSVAFWDNRSTAHLAPTDIFETDFDRQYYRITLVGEVPVGVDGRPSRCLSGEPIKPVQA